MNDIDKTNFEQETKSEVKQKNDSDLTSYKIKRSKNRKIVTVIAIIVLLLLSSVYNIFVKSDKKYVKDFDEIEFQPGDTYNLEGTITNVEKINTSYGQVTLLTLDKFLEMDEKYGWNFPSIVDDSKEYKIGDQFSKTLLFEEYRFNDNKIVTAKELWGSLLSIPTSIGIVTDAISFSNGFRLILKSTDASGTTEYEVFTPNGDSYPLKLLNASLRIGNKNQIDKICSQITSYVFFMGEYFFASEDLKDNEEVDFLESLDNYNSSKGMIQFIDKNSNCQLDDYDIFKVNILPTDDERILETYILSIGFGTGPFSHITGGSKHIINWYKGPYERQYNKRLALSYVQSIENEIQNTTIRVSRIEMDECLSYNQYDFFVQDYHGQTIGNCYGTIEYGSVVKDGITVEYIDTNKNKLLDVNDLFLIKGLENQTEYRFVLKDKKFNDRIGSINWIVGYGQVVGRIPDIELTNNGEISGSENEYKIDVSVPYWHSEFALNKTLRLSLTKDSELILDNVSIHDGDVGLYNGKNISFFDANNDSYLSANDYFVLEGEDNLTYEIELFMLFDIERYRSSVEIIT